VLPFSLTESCSDPAPGSDGQPRVLGVKAQGCLRFAFVESDGFLEVTEGSERLRGARLVELHLYLDHFALLTDLYHHLHFAPAGP
jgi:hypothetical protein